MLRRQRSALNHAIGATTIVLAALAAAHAGPIEPDQVAYDMKMSEDPAVKACILALAIKGRAGEAVDFRLVVARTKRGDAMTGPVMFGFSIEVHDPQLALPRSTAPRGTAVTSAAFISARYTAAARPRTVPFADGSWVASTLDTVEGGELVDAAASGKFQIAYTRTRPTAARVFEVTSTPPADVRSHFSGCIGGLQAIE
jgi:hypothetical protein